MSPVVSDPLTSERYCFETGLMLKILRMIRFRSESELARLVTAYRQAVQERKHCQRLKQRAADYLYSHSAELYFLDLLHSATYHLECAPAFVPYP